MKYLLVRRLPWILVWCSCAVLIGTSQPARAADPAVSGSAEAASAAMDAASPVKQPASTGKESRKPTKPQPAGGDTDGGGLSGADRFWIVLAVMVLMGGLFYLLFTWQRRIEQSGYFAGIYRDAVKDVDLIRLARPHHDRWARGDYLKEMFLQLSKRARDWLKENPRPDSKDLQALAAELGETFQDRLDRETRQMDEVPRPVEGRGRNPFDGDWGGSRTGGLGISMPPESRGEAQDVTTGREGQEKNFNRLLALYAAAVKTWIATAGARAWDWYQDDLAAADAKAQSSAELALSVDFSALRGRGPEFVLEFTAVVVIIFTALILGVLQWLTSEQIGTLLAAIAGYVLGKGSARGRQGAGAEANPSPASPGKEPVPPKGTSPGP